MPGEPIEAVEKLPQEIRSEVAGNLLELSLREICEFRTMQTDPNWSNFLYNADKHQVK